MLLSKQCIYYLHRLLTLLIYFLPSAQNMSYTLNFFPVLLSKKYFFPFSSTNSKSVPTLQLYIVTIAGSIFAIVLKSQMLILSASLKYSSVSIYFLKQRFHQHLK